MNNIMKIVMSILLGIGVMQAQAFNCEGKITQVAISSAGTVRFTSDFAKNYTQVCSTKGTWLDIDTVTCMAWFSQLQAAFNSNTNLMIMYQDTEEYSSCENLPYHGNSLKPVWLINRPTPELGN